MNNKKPNIVFFFTDDQRFNTIKALGNEHIITPNLDKLVESGTTFTHAHIPGGTCGAVCMPSRAMLNTGRTLFHLDDSGSTIPQDHALLGETLINAGYNSSGFGKWHNQRDGFKRSFTDGDDIMFDGMADHWNVPVYHYDSSGKYDAVLPTLDRYENYLYSEETRWRPADHINSGVHSTDMIADAAIKHIDRYSGKEKPFYMYLSFLAPHDPRRMPQKYLDMYDDIEVPLPNNFMAGHPFDNGELDVRDEKLAGYPRKPEEIQQHVTEYFAMITHLDDQMGRVIQALKDAGEYENTIIIYSADNGLAVGSHGLMGKQSCYDHSVRIPLIFSGPGIPENKRSDAYVYLLDIFPTLCDMLGLDIPDTVDGKSFAGLLSEADSSHRETLYLAYRDCMRGVKDRTHKLIEYVVDGKHTMTQLFDLENDPDELNNLMLFGQNEEKVKELRQELFRLRDEWDDKTTVFGRDFWSVFESQKDAELLNIMKTTVN